MEECHGTYLPPQWIITGAVMERNTGRKSLELPVLRGALHPVLRITLENCLRDLGRSWLKGKEGSMGPDTDKIHKPVGYTEVKVWGVLFHKSKSINRAYIQHA